MVQEITDVSQLPQGGKVVIDFHATWCGPCKRIAPVYVELSEKYPKISFFKVDVDQAQALSEEFSIESLPTFVIIHNGNIMKRIEGADLKALIAVIDQLEKA